MNIFKSIHNVWHIIGRNKIRSFLTMLGIIIGVMSVIIIMSAGAGAQSLILNQVKSMGSNLIGVLPGQSDDKGPPASVMGVEITSLKYDDIREIMRGQFPHLVGAAVYVKGTDTVNWSDQKTDTTFVGTSADLLTVEDTQVSAGRFFTAEEERSMARVAVLGSEVVKNLFQDIDPIGKQIKIKKTNFNIIGVMRERGTVGFQNQDNQIFVPISTAQKLLLGINYISQARVKVDDAKNIDVGMEYIRMILRERHGIDNPEDDDFSVRSMAQSVEAITSITDALKLFLAAVAAIALVVGGIGIMNIMLAAVQERTREIGLRKAVGAKNHHIVIHFLLETVMITLIGGIIGILLGIIISTLVAQVAKGLGYDWKLIISLSSILLSCVVSVGIGLIFGIVPARRASRLNPIEALRYE
ncbi:MAG: multidrug ABC transporter substrate-binding protein [Candidatus Magasanikbacteria bacterium CG10_big_fil_rev_8_21_14_0_10_36_32]|uniref:Multidrug ABC transporter substrate-binding protein n=1 Tax=Candidatus Magasanikbacteria bacterium CG10_big_fil_rev_8_21_14_0_10_36_32 TaxID=1974646 RepID=A0A2M6W5N6_9BACT|nr:MAG: multidrug ABC transporter substrate-binding protein [Candidatus Magasanikbacteria bacterium CG10_big_fil_rev_8_21_14_0_10_36_32]